MVLQDLECIWVQARARQKTQALDMVVEYLVPNPASIYSWFSSKVFSSLLGSIFMSIL